MSAGSTDELKLKEDSSRKNARSKIASQGPLRAKAISQYLKSSYRGAIALTLSHEFLVLLKALPENVVTKIQETYSRGLTSYFQSGASDVTNGKSSVVNEDKPVINTEKRNTKIDNDTKLNADAENVPKISPDPHKPDGTSKPEGILESQKKLHTKSPKEFNKFLEWNLHWEHVEARTRYLVSLVQKNYNSTNRIPLKQHLDELFNHIYQYNETRNCAIEAGAMKILYKLVKSEAEGSPILYRVRELLAILGHNPATKGQGIKILAIDGGGVRYILFMHFH